MSIDKDWRFAEVILRAWTEPGLRHRYEDDPAQVLAEAGIQTVPGEPLPALPLAEELDVVTELFDLLPAQAPATALCLSIRDAEFEPLLAGAEA
ncbi:hypothetical protein OG535_04635 [Kitasatospora sp. NBC_00085]|uniref:hypothetical protein n=1 Tax=unclassified Kitasatospora TaxID=2633591 RepID=UPI0032556A95